LGFVVLKKSYTLAESNTKQMHNYQMPDPVDSKKQQNRQTLWGVMIIFCTGIVVGVGLTVLVWHLS